MLKPAVESTKVKKKNFVSLVDRKKLLKISNPAVESQKMYFLSS